MSKSATNMAFKSKSAAKYTAGVSQQHNSFSTAIKSSMTTAKQTKSQQRLNKSALQSKHHEASKNDLAVQTPKMTERSINFDQLAKQFTQTMFPEKLKSDMKVDQLNAALNALSQKLKFFQGIEQEKMVLQ